MRMLMRSAAAIALATGLIAASTPEVHAPAKTETIVFAGGCFWGIQSVFQHTKGVVSATSGYAGGNVAKPSYEDVSSGQTGHAESVKVVFDPSQVSYEQLLKIFFSVAHDPTELNRQGPDVGTQYRSAVFYLTDAQKQETEAYIAQLGAAHAYKQPIVTQVAKLKEFYRAEDYHQDYALHNPGNPYIQVCDRPKIEALKQQFPDLFVEYQGRR